MLNEIDVSESQLIPMAQTLHGYVTSYNQWVNDANANGMNTPRRDTLLSYLQAVEDLARTAFDAISPAQAALVEQLGIPGDFGWTYELGQLINACRTARNDVNAEPDAAASDSSGSTGGASSGEGSETRIEQVDLT